MKKLISLVLAVVMAFSCTAFAFAAEATDVCPKIGDVDDDGSVTVSDARLVLRNAIKLEEFDETKLVRGDLDGNGVSVSDARMVLRIAIKLDKAPSHKVNVVTGGATEDEYAVIQSEKYAIKGVMTDASGNSMPMMLCRNGDNLYMSSSMNLIDGEDPITVGILVKGGKLYMVTEDHKYSLEFTEKIRKSFDMDEADVAEMTDISNFKIDTPPLSEATSVESEKETCPVCGETFNTGATVYTFAYSDGSKAEVNMLGKKLVSIVMYNRYGRVNQTTTFESITGNPSDSYFALPKSSLNRYPTALQTPEVAVMAFMGKLVDLSSFLK